MNKMFEALKNFAFKHFSDNTAGILIATGVAGYILSSAAQISGILFNSKLSKKEKSFLLPQETMDAVVNIATFLLITTLTKKTVGKLYQSGKWVPKSVREFLNKKPELREQIGKLGKFDVRESLLESPELLQSYDACKSFGTTVASIGAGILSSSIITPIVRNKRAAKIQKEYIDYKNNEIANLENKPQLAQQTNFKALNRIPYRYSGNMRI